MELKKTADFRGKMFLLGEMILATTMLLTLTSFVWGTQDKEYGTAVAETTEVKTPIVASTSSTEVRDEESTTRSHSVAANFPGGIEAMRQYLAENAHYPQIAQDNNLEHRVKVSFVVDANGNVTNVQVENPTEVNLDNEAIRVVSSMPRWTPAMQNGNAVSVSYSLTINFVLQ